MRDDLVTTDLRALVRTAAEEILETVRLLDAVGEAQWEAARAIALPDDDTTERAKGGHGDPVPSIVTDERRLRLRAAVIAAEREVAAAVERLPAVRRNLIDAVAVWEGIV